MHMGRRKKETLVNRGEEKWQEERRRQDSRGAGQERAGEEGRCDAWEKKVGRGGIQGVSIGATGTLQINLYEYKLNTFSGFLLHSPCTFA